ncbi:MAG TPA: DUF2950 domain-containing protein [Thermoanaerobaculia bacterium]|nr:DUF2950 domain-containing protein [Thermoanaerobaculia bacterium]
MNHRKERSPFALPGLALALFSIAVLASALPTTNPAASGAQAFDTPQQAADALVQAATAGDVAALERIFGPAGKNLVVSGDPVEDKNNLAHFAEKAKTKTHLAFDVDDPKRAILEVGDDDWPLPVPIVQNGGKWRYDANQGKEEILARRIGGNELDAIDLLRGYVEAQEEYATQLHDGSKTHQYAQKWVSTPGKQDGLSWNGPDGKPAGPIGDQIAKLLAQGYTKKAEPVNGYYFRTLTAQGPNARLGARNYIVNGMMIGGFAAIAWPARYGSTGVQTFLVNNDGVVYQKDLGPQTGTIAPSIKTFNPDKTWTVTEDEAN